jgi:hypothetical protein
VVADLLLFIPLAVLTNTAFPLPFDPVLLWFASGHTFAEACVFAGFGSGCAGLAALADVTIIGALGRRWSHRQRPGVPMPEAAPSFYAAAFLVALLPIPYTTIRLALLNVRPRPLLYALIVSGGRLPRYLVILRLWQTLAPPGWAGGALVLSAIAWMAWRGPRRARGERWVTIASRICPLSARSCTFPLQPPCRTRSGKLAFDPSTPLSTPI